MVGNRAKALRIRRRDRAGLKSENGDESESTSAKNFFGFTKLPIPTQQPLQAIVNIVNGCVGRDATEYRAAFLLFDHDRESF